MKLKIYHGFLLTCHILCLITNLMLFGFAIYDMVYHTDKIIDSVMLGIAFVFLIAFSGLHIFNTIVSFKKGSAFCVGIVYDEYKKSNMRGKFLCLLGLGISIGAFILMIIAIQDPTVFLGTSPASLKLMVIGFSLLIFIDMVFVLTYPLVGELDISYNQKEY